MRCAMSPLKTVGLLGLNWRRSVSTIPGFAQDASQPACGQHNELLTGVRMSSEGASGPRRSGEVDETTRDCGL